MSRKSSSKGTLYLILAAVVAVVLYALWRKAHPTLEQALANLKAQTAAAAQGFSTTEFQVGTSLTAPLG